MNRDVLSVLAIILTLATTASALGTQSSLEAARLLDEAEYNPLAASMAYAKVATDPMTSAPDRTEALLRKGICLARFDRLADARLAWQAASEGEGAAAAEAADYLDGRRIMQDEELDRRIKKAIANLAQEGNPATIALKELRLIGRRAVPALIEAIERSDNESTDIFACVRLVIEFGGDEAVAFLNRVHPSPNEILRRTVVQGFADHKLLVQNEIGGVQLPDSQRTEPIGSILRRFLADPDPRNRERVLVYFGSLTSGLTLSELKSGLGDPSADVRIAALRLFKTMATWFNRPRDMEWDDEVLELLREALHDDDRSVAAGALEVATQRGFMNNEACFDFYMDLLGDPLVEAGGVFPIRLIAGSSTIVDDKSLLQRPAMSSSKVMRATERLSERVRALALDEQASRWSAFANVVAYSMGTWSVEDTRSFCRLIDSLRLEVAHSRKILDKCRLRLRTTPRGIDRATANVLFRVDPNWTEAHQLYLEEKASVEEIPGFFEFVESTLTLDAKQIRELGIESFISQTLLTRPTPRARELIDRIASTELAPMLFNAALWQIGVEDYPMDIALLCANVSPPAGSRSHNATDRNNLLSWFWVEGFEPAIELFARFYDGDLVASLSPLAAAKGSLATERGIATSLPTKYDDDALAKIIVRILSTEHCEQACFDLGVFLRRRAFRVSDVIVHAVTTSFEKLDRTVQRNHFHPIIGSLDQTHPAVIALERSLLSSGDETIVGAVLSSVGRTMSSELRPEVARHLSSVTRLETIGVAAAYLNRVGDPELPRLLRDILARDDHTRRESALVALAELRIEGVVADLKAALEDPNSDLRTTACELSSTIVDRELVPDLVQCLKDPVEVVRLRAKEALDAITYYYQQESLWKRLAAGSVLEAPSAAEALLKQAEASQPKEMRLMAISSLGTLGVAETLPLLIAMTDDADADIAAASRAAVEKINAGAKR